jgi:DNA-binding NtrC family response regulator
MSCLTILYLPLGTNIALPFSMARILLCTHNPLLVKDFYGILRDEGFTVEIADHPALAVRMVLQGNYGAVIIDSGAFGLSAEEAVQIIRSISPDIPILVAGNDTYTGGALTLKTPVDLEEFKKTIHNFISLVKS